MLINPFNEYYGRQRGGGTWVIAECSARALAERATGRRHFLGALNGPNVLTSRELVVGERNVLGEDACARRFDVHRHLVSLEHANHFVLLDFGAFLRKPLLRHVQSTRVTKSGKTLATPQSSTMQERVRLTRLKQLTVMSHSSTLSPAAADGTRTDTSFRSGADAWTPLRASSSRPARDGADDDARAPRTQRRQCGSRRSAGPPDRQSDAPSTDGDADGLSREPPSTAPSNVRRSMLQSCQLCQANLQGSTSQWTNWLWLPEWRWGQRQPLRRALLGPARLISRPR